jgi:hypothetical protein
MQGEDLPDLRFVVARERHRVVFHAGSTDADHNSVRTAVATVSSDRHGCGGHRFMPFQQAEG